MHSRWGKKPWWVLVEWPRFSFSFKHVFSSSETEISWWALRCRSLSCMSHNICLNILNGLSEHHGYRKQCWQTYRKDYDRCYNVFHNLRILAAFWMTGKPYFQLKENVYHLLLSLFLYAFNSCLSTTTLFPKKNWFSVPYCCLEYLQPKGGFT